MTWHPVGMGKRLIWPLQVATVIAFALAVGAAAIPGHPGDVIAGVMIAVLVSVPLLRVVFFVGRWWQIGDRRFAAVALLLILEIGAGAVLSLT